MKTEDKVTSQPLSKRMYDLGWRYETEREWVYHWNRKAGKRIWSLFLKDEDDKVNTKIPAPDAIEIGERLPVNTATDTMVHNIVTGRTGLGTYFCRLEWCGHIKTGEIGKTEAEVRGKMWCYLKEKRLL